MPGGVELLWLVAVIILVYSLFSWFLWREWRLKEREFGRTRVRASSETRDGKEYKEAEHICPARTAEEVEEAGRMVCMARIFQDFFYCPDCGTHTSHSRHIGIYDWKCMECGRVRPIAKKA